jgi:hypothetical protein
LFQDAASVELYIDHDRAKGDKNKAIFDALHSQKRAIERDFGGPLDWQRLDGKRACRITKIYRGAGLKTPDEWPELQDKLTDISQMASPL